ncbi:MAG: DUF4129 domain-containing protein, partial [Gimesia chilikensis]
LESQYRASYRAVLDRLAGIGLHRRAGESREQFAARISSVAPTVQQLTALHLAYALGTGPALSPTRDQWAGLRQAANKEITGNTKLWRRLLFMLNPVSWAQSR